MKLSVSAFRAQASAQRKILSSYQNQLNYGACTSFPALGGYKVEEKSQTMVDSTGASFASTPKPVERHQCLGSPVEAQKESDDTNMTVANDEENEKVTPSDSGKREETLTSDRSPGRTRSRSNQRWMKLRTTVQLSGAISSTNQKSKPPLKREDSFLKRFSTRQIPETQETVDTGDETETLNGSQTQNEVNRIRRKRRKEMSKTVVNPDENFYFYWLMMVTVCVLYNLWTLIVRQSFPELQNAASTFWYSCDALADVVFVCDIMVQFRTGYLEQGLMVYDSRKLASHYFKSRAFILDLLSLLPLDFLQLNFGVNPILRFPRFFKVYRVYNYYYMVESRTVYPNLWRVVNLIHILLILAHWFGCFYYLLSEAEGFQGDWVYPYRSGEYATLTRKYLGSLYWSTLTLTTIGDLPTPETNAESRGRSKAMTAPGQSEGIPRRGHKSRLLQFNSNYGYLFTIISYLIGVFIFATIVGQVGNVITNRNANRLEFERLLDGAKTYMRHHKVPGGMKRRVLRWYDYSWSRGRIQGGGDINTALGLLPDKLKTELALHVNLSVLKKVTIFQECQPEFLHDLVLKMKAYIFTPGDLICRKGEVAREMFIIADGILDVISETGRVLTTMRAGDFFGEIGILNLDGLNKRTADVRSVGYSELFSLSREDVLTAMKDYPEAQEILQSLGRKRLMEAKNASKIYKAQVKQAKDYDSSGDSDSAGKRIVEKLRSDVKGLKNALRRSRRDTRSKEGSDKTVENPNTKHSTLRRMSHVQSSDEYDVNNDVDQSPIGAGLPLLQRLKLLKEKQEKERDERERIKLITQNGNQRVKDDPAEMETTGTGLPFSQKLKLRKQKEVKEAAALESLIVSSTVRTQVTGLRFDKSIFSSKNISPLRESENKDVGTKTKKKEQENTDLTKKEPTESEVISLKDRLRSPRLSQVKEKILPSSSTQKLETVPNFNVASETQIDKSVTVAATGVPDLSESKSGISKFQIPKTRDAWKLLKNSSLSRSRVDRPKNGGSKPFKKASNRVTYLSKSDTVLEKQKTWEMDEEKCSRPASPSDGSKFQRKALKPNEKDSSRERRRSSSVGHTSTLGHLDDDSRSEGAKLWSSPLSLRHTNSKKNKQKIKKYNSISDLSPEYSGLPFVKKLKILNERQKLEELEKELLVRSVSLDAPERATTIPESVLARSQSEASTIVLKDAHARNFLSESEEERQNQKGPVTETCFTRPESEASFEFRKGTYEDKCDYQNYSEGSIASPESNETLERKHLKSILKKLSAEESTSDEDQSSVNHKRCFPSKKRDNTEFKKLIRAPTIEGYAARHKKLTKSVTFDSDTLPSPPDAVLSQLPEEGKGKSILEYSPRVARRNTSNMIPIASPNKKEQKEERERLEEEKDVDRERSKMAEYLQKQEPKLEMQQEVTHSGDLLMPYVHQELEEKISRKFLLIKKELPVIEDFFLEIKAGIMQVLEEFSEEVQLKLQAQFSSLQTEVEKRDEIISQLWGKIQELEANNQKQREGDNRVNISEENVNNFRKDVTQSKISLEQAFVCGVSRGFRSPSPKSVAVSMSSRNSPAGGENSIIVSQEDVFFSEKNLESPFDYYEESDLFVTNDRTCLLPARAGNTRDLIAMEFRRPTEMSSVAESEPAELPPSFRLNKMKGEKMEVRPIRNSSAGETESAGTPKTAKVGRETVKPKDDEEIRPVESRSRGNFLNRVARIQRTFSCSQEKAADFVALDIDDSSTSSDTENLLNKDWEVQMLVEELERKNHGCQPEEENSNSEADLECLDDVTKLQEEVYRLKEMVCNRDLTRLTTSELDILETIIEAKDERISQLEKSSSFDRNNKTKRQVKQVQNYPSSTESSLRKCERRKKPTLKQKLGQALSFDFHDIDGQKSTDAVKHKTLYLRKQKTISCSPHEHQSFNNLWHTSSRLRNRVLEDSRRTMKNSEIGSSGKTGTGSSLPILTPSFLEDEKFCEVTTSLPALSAKECPTNSRLFCSSLKSSEELPRRGEFKQDLDYNFEESETYRGLTRNETQHFSPSSASGHVRSSDCSTGGSLNNFIKSVGQKMRQVMAGEAISVRNQVPTISKLCDELVVAKKMNSKASEKSQETSGERPEEGAPTISTEASKIPDPFNENSNKEAPDL